MDPKPPPHEQDIALLVLDPDLVDDETLWRACRQDPEARRRTHELSRLRYLLESERGADPSPEPPAHLRARFRTDPADLRSDERARVALHLATAETRDEGIAAAERFDFGRIRPPAPALPPLRAALGSLGAPLRFALTGALCFGLGVLFAGRLPERGVAPGDEPTLLASATSAPGMQEIAELREKVEELAIKLEDTGLAVSFGASAVSEASEWIPVTMGVAPHVASELTASGIRYDPAGLVATVRQSLFRREIPAGSEILIQNPATDAPVRVVVVDSHADEVARPNRDPLRTPRINLSPAAMRALGFSTLANRPLRYRLIRLGALDPTA